MKSQVKQLNPFELKSAVGELLSKINSPEDLKNCADEFELFDAQDDKKLISKMLFKELTVSGSDKIPLICFLLERYTPKEEFVEKLWETLKAKNLNTEVKVTILNLLRDLDSDWSYETCDEYLDDAGELMDENTRQMLKNAIENPEVQIDFMDFLASLRVQDKITLINSFSQDFSSDELANILIPVFVSEPNSPAGREALKFLGETKSQLALNVLEQMTECTKGELLQAVKKSLSTLKISGVRENHTKEFYKKILSGSKPQKFYLTYPDGHGDMALIFTRVTKDDRIRFVSVVINVKSGIRDCFGFYDISQFECSKILERFLRDEKTVDIDGGAFKTILYNAENSSVKSENQNWKLPYEYVCWKNLLLDIEYEAQNIEQILSENVMLTKIDDSVTDKLDKYKVSAHWFLDWQYSDEFQELLSKLPVCDLDELVQSEIDNVFNEEEKSEWVQKLLYSAYIKYSIGKDGEASEIYSLSRDEKLLGKMFEKILKRSIYEYLLLVKYDKNIPTFGLEFEQIKTFLEYIENNWVKNV